MCWGVGSLSSGDQAAKACKSLHKEFSIQFSHFAHTKKPVFCHPVCSYSIFRLLIHSHSQHIQNIFKTQDIQMNL